MQEKSKDHLEIRSSRESIQTSRNSENSAKLKKIRFPKFRIFKKNPIIFRKIEKYGKFCYKYSFSKIPEMSNIFLEKYEKFTFFFKTWMKSCCKRGQFLYFWNGFGKNSLSLSFSAKFSTQKISLNFKKNSKNAKIGVRKTLFLEA